MELAPILIAIFCFVIIKSHMDQRGKERARKLQILEEAIKGGNMDREMVDALAATLSGRRPTPRKPQVEPRPRGSWFLALGWIGIFIGLGILALGGMTDGRDADELMGAGIVVALISFGVTTYPFALRELEARRRA